MIDLRTKRIIVTGGKGFLGSRLVHRLRENRKCEHINIADLPEYDLRVLADNHRLFADHQPDIIIHLAAVVSGIGAAS